MANARGGNDDDDDDDDDGKFISENRLKQCYKMVIKKKSTLCFSPYVNVGQSTEISRQHITPYLHCYTISYTIYITIKLYYISKTIKF